MRNTAALLRRGALQRHFLKAHAALRRSRRSLFAILRTAGGESALTLVNRSERAERVTVAAEAFQRGPDGARMFLAPAYTEAITGMRITCSEGTLNLVLPPLSGAMLVSEKSGKMR